MAAASRESTAVLQSMLAARWKAGGKSPTAAEFNPFARAAEPAGQASDLAGVRELFGAAKEQN